MKITTGGRDNWELDRNTQQPHQLWLKRYLFLVQQTINKLYSWFNDLAYNFFKNNNISMMYSQMDGLQTLPIVTSDFAYLRLIGDRRLAESQFDKI